MFAASDDISILVHGFSDKAEENGDRLRFFHWLFLELLFCLIFTGWMRPVGIDIAKVTNGSTILMDYSDLSFCNYLYLSAKLTEPMGNSLADSIMKLNVLLENVRLVGHSLAGHIIAYAGAKLKGEIGELIALDPTNQNFKDRGLKTFESSAKYVQVLHTDSILGYAKKLGHADYWANYCLHFQTGCHSYVCSHLKAVLFFHASLFYEFISYDCEKPKSSKNSRFGIKNGRESGNFCFHTSKCFPYYEKSKSKSWKSCVFGSKEEKLGNKLRKKLKRSFSTYSRQPEDTP